MEKINSLIKQVKVINEKHKAIQRINGENFNIFSILKLETKEVKTHSNFIYELLNPNGSHNQGDVFLKLFLKQVLTKKEYKNIGSIIKVEAETLTDENRRIDFTIATSNIFIAIEMKINARDQEKQLSDYHRYIQNQKETTKLYYLTLSGTEASKESTKKLKVDKDYFKLSFKDDIHNWIEACIEKAATVPTLREGLIHYRNLIRKLTSQIGDEMSEEIINIIKTADDMQAIHRIYEEYVNILAKKEVDFWFELYEKIEEDKSIENFKVLYLTDSEIVNDKIDYTFIAKQRKSKKDHFGLTISKEVNEFKLECDIYFMNDDNHLTMDITILKNNSEIKLTSIETQLINIGFKRKDKEFRRYFYLKEKISFYGNGEPTFELFDEGEFKSLVQKATDEVVETLNNIVKNQNNLLERL